MLEIDKSTGLDSADKPFGQRINESPVLGIAAGLLGLSYSVVYFVGGGSIDLNSVNFLFLMLAFLLFGRL